MQCGRLGDFFTIIFIIFNIIHEDHVMNKSHRLELFIFGTIAVFVGVALAYFLKGDDLVNSSNGNVLKTEKILLKMNSKGIRMMHNFPRKKTFQIPMTQMRVRK